MKKLMIVLGFMPFVLNAQVSITASGSYLENFDGLSAAGTANPWSDNTTLVNWYSQRTGTGTTYSANNGGSNTGSLYSYGDPGILERSLGSIGSSNATAGHFAHGIQFQNNAATNVTNISVSYTMEQWRNGGTASLHTLNFYYKKSSTLITALNPNANSTWTAVPALNTTSPIASTVAGALIGNDPANKITLTSISIPGLTLLPGEFIMLKWDDMDHAGGDHGLSIDDVTIDYTVTCQTFSFLTETACNSFSLNGTPYTATGIYTQVLPNANIYGCDSTITLDLTIENALTYYQDADSDGYGNSMNSTTSCVPVAGYVLLGNDCNDADFNIHPGAIEYCDAFGIDSDCDTDPNNGVTLTYYLDSDSDGYGLTSSTQLSCLPVPGYVLVGGDCNDNNSSVNPGAVEACNGLDDNCDANVDEGALTTFYADADGDGFGDALNSVQACSAPIGFISFGGDCDDSDDMTNPDATEICDGIDNNCDGNVDEGILLTYYLDADTDGFGALSPSIQSCSPVAGYSLTNTDCNDANSTMYPGANDIPLDGIDQNCDGSDATDFPQIAIYQFEGATSCPNENPNVTAQPTEAIFSTYLSVGTSCSAANNVFNNSNWNTTTTIDLSEYNEFTITANDCYAMNLSSLSFDHRNSGTGSVTWFVRSSVDNYASDLSTGASNSTIANIIIALPIDFQGLNSVTFRFYVANALTSGTTWRQDNVSVQGAFSTLTPTTYFADTDNDGYGDANSTISTCSIQPGYIDNSDDCDDTNASINPMTVWYQDLDNDLFGNPLITATGCLQPSGYVLDNNDCDDANDQVNLPSLTYYTDNDNDGFGTGTVILYCTDPGVGFAMNNTDCDDNSVDIYPGATEICDGLDNDCNGSADDGLVFENYFLDADFDGFGAGNPISSCEIPGGNYVIVDGDCDDSDDMVYPGATDPIDGTDQNCDGVDGYVGLTTIVSSIVSISPNPTNGKLWVQLSSVQFGTISIVDLNGKSVGTFELSTNNMEIDLSYLNNGMYMLRVTSQEFSAQERIVIQH